MTDNKDKVTDIEGWKKAKDEKNDEEGYLPLLLQHMRKVRDTVPVNNVLREELRRELARRSRMAGSAAAGAAETAVEQPRPGAMPRRKWLLSGIACAAVLIALIFVVLKNSVPMALEAGETRILSRFRADDTVPAPTFNPDGSIMMLTLKGSLLLLDETGGQSEPVIPPPGEKYLCPAWSPDGQQLALARQKEGGSQEIILVSLPADYNWGTLNGILRAALAGAKVLQEIAPGINVSSLTWSPDGTALAYTAGQRGGGEEVYILETGGKEAKSPGPGKTYSLGPGRHPTWSPDVSALVVQRDYPAPAAGASGPSENKEISRLWLVDRETGRERLLGEGSLPSWGSNGYLAYVDLKLKERVLSYLPDGSPQFTVQQLTGTARAVYLGKKASEVKPPVKSGEAEALLKGGQLLATADTSPGAVELEWMRRLELNGVREPRTLYPGQTNTFEYIGFGPDARWLATCRREGDTVILSRVFVVERPLKGVE